VEFNVKQALELRIPDSYIKASTAKRKEICNGCGTAGWKGDLVPETMWGLDISEACQIHDWEYYLGSTIKDKQTADMNFLHNLMVLINRKGGWLAPFRRWRAATYYSAVRDFGDSAFWEGKDVIE
jgi:hypothetical protein